MLRFSMGADKFTKHNSYLSGDERGPTNPLKASTRLPLKHPAIPLTDYVASMSNASSESPFLHLQTGTGNSWSLDWKSTR